MCPRWPAAGFVLASRPLYAQTAEIQQRVEAKLWYLRVLARIEGATGLDPSVAISILLALVLSLAAAAFVS